MEDARYISDVALFRSRRHELVDHREGAHCGIVRVEMTMKEVRAFERAARETAVNRIVDRGVQLGASVMVPGQLGVFARKAFRSKEPIVTYEGVVYDLTTEHGRRFERDVVNPYTFTVREWDDENEVLKVRPGREEAIVTHIIDGSDPERSSLARYVNAAVLKSELNACFVQFRRDVFLVAVRDIQAGEEILTSYGEGTYDIIRRPGLDPHHHEPSSYPRTKETARKRSTLPRKKRVLTGFSSSSSSDPPQKNKKPLWKETARKSTAGRRMTRTRPAPSGPSDSDD